ncbi:MAG: hypothetical protein Q9206_006320, partial [Seirophora lacunosa]
MSVKLPYQQLARINQQKPGRTRLAWVHAACRAVRAMSLLAGTSGSTPFGQWAQHASWNSLRVVCVSSTASHALPLLFSLPSCAVPDTEPAPIVVIPSGEFLGNDGNWSTFSIGVGTPPQYVELLPSTLVPETWVVLLEGCAKEDPKDCRDTRGDLFNYAESSTWEKKNIYALNAEANLGYTGNSDNGAYGWENLTWATTGDDNITASHQVVAGIATKDFYLGSLGLAARPITWQDHSDSAPSLMTSLKTQGLLQSLSYGYTAGAFYKSAPGSLTIGGYDASRFKPSDVSFSFSSQLQRQLTVAIQGISVTNSNAESELLTQAIYALVDSTVPHLWLPLSVCQAFEHAFGIEWDPITTLYLVNDTQHEAMIKQDAEVTLSLATSLNGGSVIDITLPYASFDLEANKPLVKQKTRYFPLRRAKDETQYTVGRVFLQEAYIVVDYDRNSFSISQAQYTSGTPSDIVATDTATGTDTTSSNNNNGTSDDPALIKTTSQPSHGIGTGAIVGIAVAVVVLAAVGGFGVWWFVFRKSRKRKTLNNTKGKAELEGDGGRGPQGIDEAFGKQRPSHESAHQTKKGVTSVNIDEVPRTPLPAELEGAQPWGRRSTAEMDNEQYYRAELPSPDPFRPELESRGLALIRSELSTPEPPPSELSTSDPSLVPELTSQHLAHELPNSTRNSRARPNSYRNDSLDSDIFPSESASARPGLHGRNGSQDTIGTPISPHPRRESLRAFTQRRHSGLQHHRLNSSASHDTFETRIHESFSPQLRPQGSPSPLATPPAQPGPSTSRQPAEGYLWGVPTPPMGSHNSPALSALNSPTIPPPHGTESGPPTPGLLDLSERQPLMSNHQQRGSRETRFIENLTADPDRMTNEERQRREEARRVVVKQEVEKIEDRARNDGNQFKAGAGMGSLPDGHHHRSTTKVSHKPFKSRHSTKGVIKELTKGKIERHEKGSRKTPHQQVMSKIDRRNQAKQLRQVKHRENAKAARVFTGPSGAPRIVAVVPLCEDCDANAAIRKLNQSVDSDIEMPGEGPWKVRIDRFGQSILYIPLKRELIPAVNACRVADFVVFLLSPGQEAGEEGEQLIRAIESQGISNVLAMVQDLDSVHPAKKQPQIIGSLKSYITHFFPTLEKVHSLDSGRECANVIRSLCTTTPKGIVWREDRSWMFVEDVQWSETLNESHQHAGASLTGLVRGKGMKANRLIQVGDWGYFQIEKITDASLPTSKKRKAEEMTVDTEDAAIKILETPDEDQDDLDELAPYDETMHDVGEAPMSEAPSERKGVLLDDHHYYSDEDGSMPPQPKKLPKGTSTYQSAWFLGDMSDTYSSDDENHIDEEGDLSMEPPPLVQDEPMTTTQPEPTEATPSDYPQSEAFNDPSLLDEANELEAYRTSRKVSAAEDREYPDEIELHPNVLARERLSRYRGLRSLKTSPWDTTEDKPHEPQDYDRLLRIPAYRSARKHAANEALVGGIAPGRRVTIHLRNVPLSLRHQHQAPSSPYNPLTAFSLLRHEHKRT